MLLTMALTHRFANSWETVFLSLAGGAAHVIDTWRATHIFLGQVWFPHLAPLLLLGALPWLMRERRLWATLTERLL
jgi:hypothetical protein